jgi:cystathionine beta-lyase
MPYRIAQMRKGWREEGILVRFNVGLEDVADLIADIEAAFALM